MKTKDTTRGNKPECIGKRTKTKKTSRQIKTIQQNRTFQNNENILPDLGENLRIQTNDGWQGNKTILEQKKEGREITEKPNGKET